MPYPFPISRKADWAIPKKSTPPWQKVCWEISRKVGVNGCENPDGRGALNLKIHPQGLLSISFMFQHLAASVGKFSKKCFAFSNSTILSNYRPLTTFILSFHPWARLRGLRYCAITQSAGYGRTQRDLVYADLTICTTCNMICCTRTVADPGDGPGGTPPIFRPDWGSKGQKTFFLETSLSPTPTPPPAVISRSGSSTAEYRCMPIERLSIRRMWVLGAKFPSKSQ